MNLDSATALKESVETLSMSSEELAYLLSLTTEDVYELARRQTASLLALEEAIDSPAQIRAGAASLLARGLVEVVDGEVRPVRSVTMIAYSLVSARRWMQLGFLTTSPRQVSAAVVVVAEHLTLVLVPQALGVFEIGCMTGGSDTGGVVGSLVHGFFSTAAERGTRSALITDGEDDQENAGVVVVRYDDGRWSAGPLAQLACEPSRLPTTSAEQAFAVVHDYVAS
jgi:hypothetical protein